ncbi:hypothetical protein ABRP29_06245 [Pseudomonas sp. WHRI 8822A]|uniref:hypothetical protein n=1 Tax=Pseudomonas sp. WHRI 8822A TaxID=3162568 RepID=UPI0032EF781D
MNRDLKATAVVLGMGDRKLRTKLRELKILNAESQLIPSPRVEGRLFVETRGRWNPRIGKISHYPVVMTTEDGVAWLAYQLGIQIRHMPPRQAGSQA